MTLKMKLQKNGILRSELVIQQLEVKMCVPYGILDTASRSKDVCALWYT